MAANTSKLSSTTTIITVKRQRQRTTSIMKRNNRTIEYNQILLITIIIMISQYYVESMNAACNICSNPTIQSKNNDTVVDMTGMIILGMGDMSTCQELSELGNMGFYSDELCINIKQRIDIQVLCGCVERVGARTPSGRSIVHSNSPSAVPTSSPTPPTLVQVTIVSYGDARQGFSNAQKKTQPTISPTLVPSLAPSLTATVRKKKVPPPVGAQGRSQSVERPSVSVVSESASSTSITNNNMHSAEFFKDASDLKDAMLANSEGEGQIKTTTKKRMKEYSSSKKSNKNNSKKNKYRKQSPPNDISDEENSNKQKKEKDQSNNETTPVKPSNQKKPIKNKPNEELSLEYVQGLIRRRSR